jgi:hypothetical protein
VVTVCSVQLECDGTRWRTGGEVKGKLEIGVVASTLHTTSEHGVSSITTADAHTSAASSRLNWRPRRFKWTRPFPLKTKCGFCAWAITFQLASTTCCNVKEILRFATLCYLCTDESHSNKRLFLQAPLTDLSLQRACAVLSGGRNWSLIYKTYTYFLFFHSRTVHLDNIKVFYLPTDVQESCFKRMLKFTLKQLLHVSFQTARAHTHTHTHHTPIRNQ